MNPSSHLRNKAHIQMFLLGIGIRFDGKSWTGRHRVWLSDRRFEHAGQQIAFQSFLNRVEQAEARKVQLETQIAQLCSAWSLAPLVTALQALKGLGLVIAATLAAEIGDFGRFPNPRHLMAWLGLVPGEHSSGGSVRQRGLTKAGNTAARSLLFEAAWSYRTSPKVGQWQLSHRPYCVSDPRGVAVGLQRIMKGLLILPAVYLTSGHGVEVRQRIRQSLDGRRTH